MFYSHNLEHNQTICHKIHVKIPEYKYKIHECTLSFIFIYYFSYIIFPIILVFLHVALLCISQNATDWCTPRKSTKYNYIEETMHLLILWFQEKIKCKRILHILHYQSSLLLLSLHFSYPSSKNSELRKEVSNSLDTLATISRESSNKKVGPNTKVTCERRDL